MRQHFELTSFMHALLLFHCHITQFCPNVKQSNSRCWWGGINVFFYLKFFSRVFSTFVSLCNCSKLIGHCAFVCQVDTFTVRPSGPNLSIVCGHNCFLVVDYLCQTISAKSTTVFAGQSLKLRLIMHSTCRIKS